MTGWDSLIGHERVVQSLRRAVTEDRPNHAYLFLGAPGVGKRTVADTLARALVCAQDDPACRPCGECAPCSKVLAGSHPDVWAEEPSGKSHMISSDQITELQRRLSYRRAEGRYRIVILDEANHTGTQAQNKLLKTLEEPPEGTVLILCAVHPGQLLITVRSRCQKLALGIVAPQTIEPWLVEQHGAAPHDAARAAAASRGIPGLAVALLDSERSAERQARVGGLSEALSGNREAIDLLVSSVDRDRPACEEVFTTLQQLLRDAMLDSAEALTDPIHPGALPDQGLLSSLGPRQLADRIARVEVCRERLRRNVGPAVLLEDLLVYLSVESPRP